MIADRTADTLVASGITFFGIALADLGVMVTIFAGLSAGVASIAATVYYIRKSKS